MKLGRWSTTAASNNSTPPDGWPEGQAPSTVNDCAREMMAAIRTAFQDLAYVDQDLTPTFVTASSFTVPGDQTSAIHAGRRLKIFDGTAGVATTIYATVATASFTAVTTIHISADGGQLTSSLSSFAISIIPRDNSPLPNLQDFDRLSASAIETTSLSVSGDTTVKGNLTVSGQAHIGQLSVGGAAALGSTLTVSGAAALLGNVFINGNLSVSGQASVLNLSVSGTAVFAGAFVQINSSFLQANTTLTLSGTAVLKRDLLLSGTAVLTGNMQIGTTLTVGGAATLNGGLNVSNSAVLTGAVRLHDTLTASGAVTLNTTLTVGGATTLLSTLTVSGALTLTSGQINFPAAQNASAGANTLDDYEEGTFTPTILIGGVDTGHAYNAQTGHYTKIGNTVTARFFVALSATAGLAGTVTIGGLPFATLNASNSSHVLALYGAGLSAISGALIGLVVGNATTIIPRQFSSNGAAVQLTAGQITNTGSFGGTFTYLT